METSRRREPCVPPPATNSDSPLFIDIKTRICQGGGESEGCEDEGRKEGEVRQGVWDEEERLER